jgi:hypothetical protein
MAYRLKKVDDLIGKATRDAWTSELRDADENFSPAGYYNLLDSVSYRLTLKGDDDHFYHYALIDSDKGNTAQAILGISHVLPNLPDSYLKVLSIRMTPRLDTRNVNTELNNRVTRHAEIAKVAAGCIAGALELTESVYPVDSFKLYTTSTQTDLDMLLYVTDSLSQSILKDAGINADSHGNWLVISKS